MAPLHMFHDNIMMPMITRIFYLYRRVLLNTPSNTKNKILLLLLLIFHTSHIELHYTIWNTLRSTIEYPIFYVCPIFYVWARRSAPDHLVFITTHGIGTKNRFSIVSLLYVLNVYASVFVMEQERHAHCQVGNSFYNGKQCTTVKVCLVRSFPCIFN